MCQKARPPLRWQLVKRNITSKRLAEGVGVTPTWIGAICSGRATPSPELRARIAAFVGASERELFGEEGS